MNIHITKEELNNICDFDSIKNYKNTIGSHLYSLNNDDSDNDYIILYINKGYSFLWDHHQLQYKEDNCDYMLVDLKTFVRNILTGDSTVNFEMLYSEDFKNTKFGDLCNYKEDMINYNLIKSYLGIAKRDLKDYNKNKSNKKAYHFVRGVMFANYLLDGEFTLDLSSRNTFYYDNDYNILEDIRKNGLTDNALELFSEDLVNLRKRLNKMHDARSINMYMDVDRMIKLDHWIDTCYLGSSTVDFEEVNKIFYNALENGIKYDKK